MSPWMFYFQVVALLKEKCQASAGAIPAMQISLCQYAVWCDNAALCIQLFHAKCLWQIHIHGYSWYICLAMPVAVEL